MAAQGNSDAQAIDIDQWVGSLERILEDVPHYMCASGHPGKVSRIPDNLREVDSRAYEPYLLSIGPYHHGKKELEKMEEGKRDLLRCFLEQKPEVTLKAYLKELKSIEPEARSFYSDIEMKDEEFIRMLLLDCVCVLTTFCGMPNCQRRTSNINSPDNGCIEDTNERLTWIDEAMQNQDDIESMPLIARAQDSNNERSGENHVDAPRWFWSLFIHDIFLLENQLPFFVLRKLHDLAYGDSETSLIGVLEYEFSKILWEYTRLDSDMMISPSENVHHLLHLCHMFFRPILPHKSTICQLNESNQMFRLESAVQLYEAGVTFESRSSSSEHSLLDITFGNSGKMVMPCLCVDDNTNSLLRNLIALEQMKYPSMGLNVCAYAVLLLHLITTPDDVKLLRRKGIIHHHLSSDKEMVYFINRLSVGLAFDYIEDNYSLKPVFRELQSYSQRRMPRWRAWLKHRHFKNPWTMISLLAGFLLLFLTFIQTYYTVYCYYNPCLLSGS